MQSPRPRKPAHHDNLALVEQLLTDATRTPGHLGHAASYLL